MYNIHQYRKAIAQVNLLWDCTDRESERELQLLLDNIEEYEHNRCKPENDYVPGAPSSYFDDNTIYTTRL